MQTNKWPLQLTEHQERLSTEFRLLLLSKAKQTAPPLNLGMLCQLN